ncbi:MAG: guanylate kinase [Holosporaceae bacterium]|jgi:guanylate kinase|nr:guanylate kinase [Holosporaceae bacterium]
MSLFVVSGPSAVGKSSVVERLLKMDPSIERIVTCTTRNPRRSEQPNVDYFFIPKNEFLAAIDAGDFVEFSEVYGNYYGVKFSTIQEKIAAHKDVILTINWEGFLKIKDVIKQDVYGIFILPPSIADLEIRIKLRGEDSPEVIAGRINAAKEDIAKANLYDFCFENFDIGITAENILSKFNEIRNK